jgi:hypothetical protein
MPTASEEAAVESHRHGRLGADMSTNSAQSEGVEKEAERVDLGPSIAEHEYCTTAVGALGAYAVGFRAAGELLSEPEEGG